ncbi:hypothetical protein WICMUC_004084 [Wickerhamomyces mucosus]|uniref:LicD/FKTN/FKRP nucleotidyltransferase domain-containing protein n=1 Tax=Wickerhamomyces mucosus TaxID=1378264 RepID=A0A9P8PJA6_9ASCO|nr:hypothetical protein WICMUC_004084 [Wickerhamomyces mucosus]
MGDLLFPEKSFNSSSWSRNFFKFYNLFKKSIPFWYLISLIFGLFVYFTKKTNIINNFNDVESIDFDTSSYKQDPSYVDPAVLTSIKKPTIFEDYPHSFDDTVLPIAPYKHVQEKLDFAATQAIYLEAIKTFVAKSSNGGATQPPIFNFNWKDFVDLNILKPLLEEKPSCFRIGALGATSRIPWSNCLDEPQNLGFVFITPSLDPETEFRLSIRGKSYLYTAAPLPNKLIFLAGELAFVTKIGKNYALDENTMIDEYVQRKLKDNPTIAQSQIIRNPIDPKDEMNDISKILKRSLISFDAPKSLKIEVDKSSFTVQLSKERSVQANAARHHDDRHFRDVLIKSKDGKWVSEEFYDWRFFNKKLNNLNKRKSLHSVVENYLQLCTNLGIKTWLSAESMVSWQQNGLIGPWEDVVKFELPASDLQRIANSFNYSLIISDPRNGTGNYLIDISPWYLERARYNDGGAAPDIADGRIIDTKTGLYIELSGVIQAPRVPKEFVELYEESEISQYVVTGRGNFWHLPSLLPLNRTIYEGKLANVPHFFPNDYKVPDNYVFQDHLRLFVDENKCSYVPEEEKIKFDQTYIGSCHDNLIWKEYNFTKFATMNFLTKYGQPLNVLDEINMNF